MGGTRDTKLRTQMQTQESPVVSQPTIPNKSLPSNPGDSITTPNSNNDTVVQSPTAELSLGDRLENMFIGAGLGFLVGGSAVMLVGVGGTAAVGSATTYIAALGGTGAQTFSIGALAYDVFAMVFAPFFGVELEPIEVEP